MSDRILNLLALFLALLVAAFMVDGWFEPSARVISSDNP